MIGKTVSHYKILEEIGRGGMGVVYKAEDTRLDRFVAVKFLPQHLVSDEDARARFIHEAKAASALNHPNIGVIYEVDETTDGQTFIVMAYYQGETLRSVLDRGDIEMGKALEITAQIASGLASAHRKGIVHRDIKPSNILLTDDARAIIIDFGLAKLAGHTRLTKERSTLGTVAYMSPEQALGGDVDGRSDIFSLGSIMYEMVAGFRPFTGEHEAAMLYEIVHEEPQPLSGARQAIPDELVRIATKAMTKSPDERYQKADEMLADLSSIMKRLGTPAATTQERPPADSRKKLRRNIIAIICLSIVIAFGAFFLKPLLFEGDVVSTPKPIAVIGFENHTGDDTYDYLCKVIPNLLITSLEQSKYVSVATMERLRDLAKQAGKDDVDVINADVGFELCRMDGIDAIVIGSFSRAGDIFVTDLKVLDVATKKLLKSAGSKGRGVSSILERQVDDLSREISKGIDLPEREREKSMIPVADVTTTSMEAYTYYIKGKEAFQKIYNETAQRYLDRAVELDSSFASAYLLQSISRQMSGDYEGRNEALEKAKIHSARATEKERLYIEAWYAFAVEQKPEKFHRVLTSLPSKYDKEKDIHLWLASIYYWPRKMFDESIAEFNAALELDPNYGPALNNMTYAYASKRDFDKAFYYLEKYTTVCPREPNPFDTKGELYLIMGNLDESIASYKEALRIRPEFSSDRSLAYVYALKEDYPQSLKWIERYITFAVHDELKAMGHLWKGFYRYWLGDLSGSLAEFERAEDLAIQTENEDWKYNADWLRSWIYYDQGDIDQGEMLYKSYYEYNIAHYPPMEPYYSAGRSFFHGLLALKEERIDEARTMLEEMASHLIAVDSYSANQMTYFHDLLHAEILLAEGVPEKAASVWEHSREVEIPFMYEWEHLILYNLPFCKDVSARAYAFEGDLDSAIAEYERLITFDPEHHERRLIHPLYHYRLARLYEDAGRRDEAVDKYKEFLEIWKIADENLPALIDAKERLARLKESHTG